MSATVHLSPAETRAQYEARARVAAASVKTLEPLRQATDACVRGVMDHMQNLTMKAWLKSQVAPVLHKAADLISAVGTIYGDGVSVVYRWKNGGVRERRLRRRPDRLHRHRPDSRLQAVLHRGSARDRLHRGRVLVHGSALQLVGPATPQEIAAACHRWRPGSTAPWRLIRLAPTKCIHFPRGCARTPIPLRFQRCAATACSLSRTDGDWQRVHRIARHGALWSASFKDIAINCDDGKHAAEIEGQLSVTSAKGSEAKSVGGTYKVHAPANPTNCPEGGRARGVGPLRQPLKSRFAVGRAAEPTLPAPPWEFASPGP